MKYNKIPIGPYNLHLIETSNFKDINIYIDFKRKINKEEVTIRKFLAYILVESSKKYPTNRQMNIAEEELYGLLFSTNQTFSSNVSSLLINASYLNDQVVEDKNQTENVIKFLAEILFNPDVSEKEFKKDKFDLVKNLIKEEIEKREEDTASYANESLQETMDPDHHFFFRSAGYLEDLDNITTKNLYEYYIDVLNNDEVDIFVTGNFDSNQIKELISLNFPLNKNNYQKIKFETNIVKPLKVKNKIIKKNINQSWLTMGYRIDSMTKFEQEYVSRVYSLILGGGGASKLFMNVREKNSLCYTISANIAFLKGILIIRAGINKENYQKALELIEIEFDNMKQGKITLEEVENAKNYLVAVSKKQNDNIFNIRNQYVEKDYFGFNLSADDIKNIKKVRSSDIITFANKISLDTIFLLEGSLKNEEN